MSRATIILIFLILLSPIIRATDISIADSIVEQITRYAPQYHNTIKEYETEVYMKTLIQTPKKNFLYRFTYLVPNFVLHDRNNDTAFIESVSRLKFIYPERYYQDIKAVNGTLTHSSAIAMLPFNFMSINIYNEFTPDNVFILPTRAKTVKYYNYTTIKDDNNCNTKNYFIKYTPKHKNPKLLSGIFEVEPKTWRIVSFRGKGSDLFLEYNFEIFFHNDLDELSRFLPSKIKIAQSYSYLGNRVKNLYIATFNYKYLIFNKNNSTDKREKNFNLGNKYQVRMDSVPIKVDTLLWKNLRHIPIANFEENIIKRSIEKRKKTDTIKKTNADNKTLEFIENMTQSTNYRFNSVNLRYSGLLNPSMFGYSTYDGLSFKQSVNLNFNIKNHQTFNINGYAGYVSGKKHFSYNVGLNWNYNSLKNGYLSFDIGKGNPAYSTYFIESIKDSTGRDTKNDPQNLNFYKDYYIRIFNNIELFNGFQLGVGIDYNTRKPNRPIVDLHSKNVIDKQSNLLTKVGVSWTPAQYYFIDNRRKVYVKSKFPTIRIEYAKSIPWLSISSSKYSRIEANISQKIDIDLLQNISYSIGAGTFLDKKSEYFNDFRFFTKNYFPDTWNDGIGGNFNALKYQYFNSSKYYSQLHIVYETPKLLLTRLHFLSNAVAKERLYLSTLHLSSLNSYTEIGYGIGNKYMNMAAIVALYGFKYHDITAKIVFLF